MKTATGDNQLYILIFKIIFSAIAIAISFMANADSLDTDREKQTKYLSELNIKDEIALVNGDFLKYNPEEHCEIVVFKVFDLNDELVYEKKLNMKGGVGQNRVLFILLNKSDFLFRDGNVIYYMLSGTQFIVKKREP